MKNVFRYAASSSTRRSPPPSPSKPIRQLGQAPFLVPLNLVTPRLTAGYATNAVAEQNRRRESDDEVEVYVKGKRIYPEDAGVKVGGKRLAVVARVTSKDMKVEEEVGAKAYPKEGARRCVWRSFIDRPREMRLTLSLMGRLARSRRGYRHQRKECRKRLFRSPNWMSY